MRQDLTDITLIIDRSGSMQSCQQEAQGGINAFIIDQKKQKGNALFSLLQFDTEYEYIYNAIPIDQVKDYILSPRGMTALLDAIGKAINETGQRLEKLSEKDRPGLVIIAIITDGQENSSHEFTKKSIKEMIEKQQNIYNWKFTFLGANQDSFTEASSIGIQKDSTTNYNATLSGQAYNGLSSNVARMRSASLNNQPVSSYYTDDERKNMTN